MLRSEIVKNNTRKQGYHLKNCVSAKSDICNNKKIMLDKKKTFENNYIHVLGAKRKFVNINSKKYQQEI